MPHTFNNEGENYMRCYKNNQKLIDSDLPKDVKDYLLGITRQTLTNIDNKMKSSTGEKFWEYRTCLWLSEILPNWYLIGNQMPIYHREKGQVTGYVDILGFDLERKCYTIFELKQKATAVDILQIVKYMTHFWGEDDRHYLCMQDSDTPFGLVGFW